MKKSVVEQIIQTKNVSNQSQLLDLYEAETKHRPNQSTISRNLMKMGIKKHNGVYRIFEPIDLQDTTKTQSVEKACTLVLAPGSKIIQEAGGLRVLFPDKTSPLFLRERRV